MKEQKVYDLEYIVELLQAQEERTNAQYKAQEKRTDAKLLILLNDNKIIINDNKIIKQKLDRIEENTIIIRDIILSDFEGITKTSKKAIEASAETALENKEEILHDTLIWNPLNPEYHEVESKVKRQEMREFKLTSVINGYNPPQQSGLYLVQTPDLREKLITSNTYSGPCGNWVNSKLSQVFKTSFHGNYPVLTRELLDNLVSFWVMERIDNGRMY